MTRKLFARERRRLLVGAGVLAALGAGGLLVWPTDRAPLADPPPGWFLVSRASQSSTARELVAQAEDGAQHELETGIDIAYLDAAVSPDSRYLAVLKRVPRGSMPTDAVALFDRRTFRKLSEIEVQIDFQDIPTYTIVWSADGARLAVPYNYAGRTLVFGVHGGEVGLQSMLRRDHFRFHPTEPDLALYELDRPNRGSTGIGRFTPGAREQRVEVIEGASAEWSPDGAKLAYVTGSRARGRQVVVRDEAARAVIATLPLSPVAAAWSPDSRQLAVYASVTNDPLRIAHLVPEGLIPGWQPGAEEPALIVYDTAARRSVTIKELPAGFRLARLQWAGADWLLMTAARADQSFAVDRRGERRRPLPVLDDFTQLLAWLPEKSA